MSNQDEDEVAEELDALEAEMSGTKLPDAPRKELPGLQKETIRATTREREAGQEREMISA
jgi:charged multivesicular body protein 6